MHYKSHQANRQSLTESDLIVRSTSEDNLLYLNSKIARDLYRIQISFTIQIVTSIKSK